MTVVVGFRYSTGLTDLGGIDSAYIAFEGLKRCDRLIDFYRYSCFFTFKLLYLNAHSISATRLGLPNLTLRYQAIHFPMMLSHQFG